MSSFSIPNGGGESAIEIRLDKVVLVLRVDGGQVEVRLTADGARKVAQRLTAAAQAGEQTPPS